MKKSNLLSVFPSLRVGLVASTFWASLLPYHFKQYLKLGYGAGSPLLSKVCYALVGAFLVLSFLAASLSERSRSLIKKGIQSNRYVLLYSVWILFGQVIGLLKGFIGASSFAMASAYAVTAFVGFYSVPAFLSRAGRLEHIMKTLAYVGVLVSLSGLFANLTGAKSFMGITLLIYKRVPLFGLPASTGFLHEFNIYGLVAGLGFWGSCYFLVQRRRIFHLMTAGICLVAVFFSDSRAIYLAVAVGIAILSKPFKRKWYTQLSFGVVALGGAVLGYYVAFETELGAEILRTDASFANVLAGRAILWPAAISAIADQPLRGYGFGGTAFTEAIWNHGASILRDTPMPAHNAFLDISLQGGALLGVFYVAAVVRSVRRLWRARAYTYEQKMRTRILGIILITVFLAAMFMSHSLGGIGYVSLVLTMFTGIANLWPELEARNEKQSLANGQSQR